MHVRAVWAHHAMTSKKGTTTTAAIIHIMSAIGQWLLIASVKDDEPVSNRPVDAITFSLGDLWP